MFVAWYMRMLKPHSKSCQLQLRFNEWGRAVADLQIKHLEGTLTGNACPDWHFMAFGHPDDLDVAPLRRHIASLLMKVGPMCVSVKQMSPLRLFRAIGMSARVLVRSRDRASLSPPRCLLWQCCHGMAVRLCSPSAEFG